MIYLGCAGWSISRIYAAQLAGEGSHLQRYARQLTAVEINSSFYRPHRPATYARWAGAVPPGFRFSVKLPRAISHERRLVDCAQALAEFFAQCTALGPALGCVLVQLPPSLAFEPLLVERFMADVRKVYPGPVALEARHPSWVEAAPLMEQLQVALVAADPARFALDAQPRGWPGLAYWRLHGSPRTYFSDYPSTWLQTLAPQLLARDEAGAATWCIFDNTAGDAALGDALELQTLLGR